MSSTTKLITALFMINSNLSNQCLSGNNRGIKQNIIRKTILRIRVKISKIKTLVQKTLSFYKILNEESPAYLFDLIPNLNRVHETRHDYFKNSFFPSTISEWKKLDWKIRNPGNLSMNLLNFMRTCANSIFKIHNPYGIKLLTTTAPRPQ